MGRQETVMLPGCVGLSWAAAERRGRWGKCRILLRAPQQNYGVC